MRTQAIALVVLIFSGAALAQDPLGDDTGPNANDGQCDDSRFENIGAGNSNIVFWEGGRYDGRDATDCRDLLLQGLINWRDGVDPRVDIVLATGDFGDDGGPNANDGQCDDSRFENIGAGNSNIVFWEGGRYDGRDATDCADLLLQGLVAWRRDAAMVEAPAKQAMSTASEAQRQEATTLPEGVTADSICTDNPERRGCWKELGNLPDCYVWSPDPGALEIDSWSGQCSDGLGTGTGLYRSRFENQPGTAQIPYVNGKIHGTQVLRLVDGFVRETPWVNGVRHGTSNSRSADGTVNETPYVNGVEHGTSFTRYADGRVGQTSFVNGVLHGTNIWYINETRYEVPYVNGVEHGTQTVRRNNGNVTETPYVNGMRHGIETDIWTGDDGLVVETQTPYVNDMRHGTQIVNRSDGGWEEWPYVNGELDGTATFGTVDGEVRETVWVNGEIESRRCVAGCD